MKNGKNSLIGFFISLILHISLLVSVLMSFETKKDVVQESVMIKLDNFIIQDDAGQQSDSNQALAQNEVVQETNEEIAQEVVEEVKEDEVVEEVKEEIIEEPVIEPIPQPKPKPKPKPKKKPTEKEKVKNETQTQKIMANTATATDTGLAGKNASSQGASVKTSQGSAKKDNVFAKIQQIISNYAKKHYPNQAKRRHQQGKVSIKFTYHQNGDVTGLKVTSSSNVASLDEAAIKAIQKTKKHFPKIDETYEISTTINFEIYD